MRSLLAFIALPGVVAYALPLLWAWHRPTPRAHWLGLSPLLLGGMVVVVGSVLLAACTLEFHRRGHGALAPWAPPRRLVTSGLYARSRNPMGLAVLLVLAGWFLAFRSGALALYAAAVALAFHLRVVLTEEPRQSRVFAAEWTAYLAKVPRWLPPLRQWPWWLWLGAGWLFGASLWALSPALLGSDEPWDSDVPVWNASWPVLGAFAAAARHWRGLWLPIGYALAQAALTIRALWASEFGPLGWMFLGLGLGGALAVALALLGVLALWRRVNRFKKE
jgi:protein-S-isoprenylcysteine O-methyltransferase Ste14